MAKLILIISTVLIAVSIVLGIMNRNKFISVREEKDAANASTKILLAETEDVITEIEDTKGMIASIEDERDIANEEISASERKINAANAKIAAAQQSMKEAELKIAEFQEVLKEFEGVTPETLNEKIEEMEMEIAKKAEEVTALQEEIEVTQAKVASNQESIRGYQSEQTRRSQDISLNASRATITAVNNDWGFVIIDAGQNRGIESDDKLIVSRGNQKVGQLDIISIEPDKVVANIIPESLNAGAILPGDTVVFEAAGSGSN